MAQYDGEIIINTKIKTDGFNDGTKQMKAGSADVERAVRKMASTIEGVGESAKNSLNKAVTAFAKQNSAYAQQEQKVEALRSKIDELSRQTVETDEFAEIGKQIEDAEKRLNRLYEAQALFLQSGGNENSSAYTKRKIEIENIEQILREAKAEQNELLNSGQAYQPVDTSGLTAELQAEQDKLRLSAESLQNSLDGIASKVGELARKESEAESSTNRFGSVLSKLKNVTNKVGNAVTTSVKNFLGFSKSSRKVNSGIKHSIGTMLKYTLSIRSLFNAVKKLKSAFTEGINNLVQHDKTTNASMSSMMNSLNQLKNSLATAFSPIINVVAPIITKFIGYINDAVNAIGKFLSALTGKSTYTQAVKGNEDYAASVNKSSEATKKANKENKRYLSGLDDIRQFDEQGSDSSSTSGSGSSGVTYEEVAIDESIGNFAQKFKDLINADDWEGVGSLLASKLNVALNAVQWGKIGDTIGGRLQQAFDVLKGFVDTYKWGTLAKGIATSLNHSIAAIDWAENAKTLSKGFAGIFKEISAFLQEVDWEQIGEDIAVFVKNIDYSAIASSIFEALGSALGASLSLLWGFIKGIAREIVDYFAKYIGKDANPGKIIEGLYNGIVDGIKNTAKWVKNNISDPFFKALSKSFGLDKEKSGAVAKIGWKIVKTMLMNMLGPFGQIIVLFDNVKDKIKSVFNKENMKKIFGDAVAAIKSKFENIREWFGEKFTGVKDKIKSVFNKENMKKIFGDAVSAIKEKFNVIPKWFKEKFTEAWNNVKNVFNNRGKIFSGIKEGISETFSKVVKKLIEGINKVIKVPFDKINGMLNSIRGVSIGGFKPFEKLWNKNPISTPQIPVNWLADGAVIPPRSEFLAVLGDQKRGNNIETPEALLRKVVREESGNNRGAGGSYQFTAQINRRTLFDEMINEAKLRKGMTRKNPFELA